MTGVVLLSLLILSFLNRLQQRFLDAVVTQPAAYGFAHDRRRRRFRRLCAEHFLFLLLVPPSWWIMEGNPPDWHGSGANARAATLLVATILLMHIVRKAAESFVSLRTVRAGSILPSVEEWFWIVTMAILVLLATGFFGGVAGWSMWTLLLLARHWWFPGSGCDRLIPLEGALAREFDDLGNKTGFNPARISAVAHQGPPSQANARAGGFGPQARVMLHGGLSELLGREQLRAVVAHEIGHIRRLHHGKYYLLLAGLTAPVFLLSHVIVTSGDGDTLLHWAIVFSGMYLFTLPTGHLLLPVFNAVRRAMELDADEYAGRYASGSDLVEALSRLRSEPSTDETMHPLYARWYNPYPSFDVRRERLSRNALDSH